MRSAAGHGSQRPRHHESREAVPAAGAGDQDARHGSVIDTDHYSRILRVRAVDLSGRRLLVADLRNSAQEPDLSEPVNCGGYGRIRHFARSTAAGWPDNPLPVDPAAAALGLPAGMAGIRAQVFQNAACNWRCWYCFVPFELLSANPGRGAMFTAGKLTDAYLALPARPPVLDLSGGQPDLVPEWVPWMLHALDDRRVSDVYLWSDDNLSTSSFFTRLPSAERAYVAAHARYGRVACFKGFDAESFAFNTKAAPELFARQFRLFARLLETGMDLYGYATFTTPNATQIPAKMRAFADRLQHIAEHLPLRVVPLQIEVWGPVGPRMRDLHRASAELQQEAIAAWDEELSARFTPADRARPVTYPWPSLPRSR
jgi:uncharacterized Fe-S cluster-containing radical SAM superfamily protein